MRQRQCKILFATSRLLLFRYGTLLYCTACTNRVKNRNSEYVPPVEVYNPERRACRDDTYYT